MINMFGYGGIGLGFYNLFDIKSMVEDMLEGGYFDKEGNFRSDTTTEQDLIIYIANTIVDKTKLKKVTLNYLEYIGFESKNRVFELYPEEHYSFKLIIKSKPNCKYEKVDKTINFINGITFLNWLKKNNYYKR